MSSHAVVARVMGQKRQLPKLRLVLALAALSILPLSSRRFNSVLRQILKLLPLSIRAHWLVGILRRTWQIAMLKDGTNADPFQRLPGRGEAFQALFELTDLMSDARNNGFVHTCRARDYPEGEFAVKLVPKAQHPLLQRAPSQETTGYRQMALKPKVTETEDFRKYMRTLLRLRHDNVVRYERFFADEINYYFVMERCPGLPLPDYVVKRDFWVESEVRLLQKQLLQALAYIHSMGIIHRDIKMENLIVSLEGEMKLIDFGLGCPAELAEGEVGTEGFTAPEVFSRSSYGPGIDIFSAGVCLHVLLSGKPPFRMRERIEEYVHYVLAGARLDAPAFKLVTQACSDFLLSLLDPVPQRRPTANQALGHPWFTMSGLDCEGPRLWSTADSEVEFQKVMGAWSGSFSRGGSTSFSPGCVSLKLSNISEDDDEEDGCHWMSSAFAKPDEAKSIKQDHWMFDAFAKPDEAKPIKSMGAFVVEFTSKSMGA